MNGLLKFDLTAISQSESAAFFVIFFIKCFFVREKIDIANNYTKKACTFKLSQF